MSRDMRYLFALEVVEMFGEGAAVVFEVMTLDEEHEEGVDFIEGIEETEEVAGMAVGCESEEVAEGGWNEGGELVFGEDFWG